MAWTDKEKELVAVGCRPCTDYHFNKVRETGATDDEIRQAMAIGIRVRNSATNIIRAFAYREARKTAVFPLGNRVWAYDPKIWLDHQ